MTFRSGISDEEVEEEIKELLSDPDVKLAKAEEQFRNRRRQYLYKLRGLKKKGAEMRDDPEFEWLREMVEGEGCC